MILKKRRERLFVSLLVLVSILFVFSLILAADVEVDLAEQNAAICIRDSQAIRQNMIADGFNVLSINDSLKQAESLFDSQVVLREQKKNYDFSLVMVYCENIKQIREDALMVRDDFNSLLKFYEESKIPGMDTTSIDSLINDINEAIVNERYPEASSLVEKTYTEITDVRSAYTAVNLFYQATTRGIVSFLLATNKVIYIPGYVEMKNWHFFLGLFVLILLFLLIYRVKIMKRIVEKKIEKLEIRRKTIKELVMQTQRDYFQFGKIPEGEYNIKTKRFAELVRDIDRQMPLLKEELVKLSGGVSSLKQTRDQDIRELVQEKKSNGFSWKNLFKKKESDKEIKVSKKRILHKSFKVVPKKIKKMEKKKKIKVQPKKQVHKKKRR